MFGPIIRTLWPAVTVAAMAVTAASMTSEGRGADTSGWSDTLGRFQLTYEGAFRLPKGEAGESAFAWGGTALAFDSTRRSLWLVGHEHHQQVAEISIPTVVQGTTLEALDTAHFLTPFADILKGRLQDVGDADARIGGLLRVGSDWIVTGWVYYDAAGSQSRSHFRTTADGRVLGPVQLGSESRRAGFVSGYMTMIPPEWRSSLGGSALTGQCCVPIIERSSLGPALSVFDPADVGARTPVPATQVLGYPIDHPTLGTWEAGTLYNGTAGIGGVVFAEGTSTVLFFGDVGTGPVCYGIGTSDERLHGRPVPGHGGTPFCYDPIYADHGTHAYPYVMFLWAYDANDLVAVKQGRQAPWEVRPYASGAFDLPFESERKQIGGAAYDPATRRVFLLARFQDGEGPVIHVMRLDSSQPSPPGGPSERGRPTANPPVGRALPRW